MMEIFYASFSTEGKCEYYPKSMDVLPGENNVELSVWVRESVQNHDKLEFNAALHRGLCSIAWGSMQHCMGVYAALHGGLCRVALFKYGVSGGGVQ